MSPDGLLFLLLSTVFTADGVIRINYLAEGVVPREAGATGGSAPSTENKLLSRPPLAATSDRRWRAPSTHADVVPPR